MCIEGSRENIKRFILLLYMSISKEVDFPGGLVVKNPHANAGDTRDAGLIPVLGRYPGVGNDNPL